MRSNARRRVVGALGAAVVLMAVAAAPVGAAPPTKVGMAYGERLGDSLFDDLAHDGAVRAQEDLGVKLFERGLVAKSGKVGDEAAVVRKLAKKSGLVVAVGFPYQPAVDAAAAADAGTNFAVIDSVSQTPQSNVLGATTAANEGSFLVGAAAALESGTGRIGFIGGTDIPVIQEFEAGFVAGVGEIDAAASVAVEYVALQPDFGGFGDPARAYEIAMEMYDAGADVVFHAAGASGSGLFYAARDWSVSSGDQVWAIGVDTDQYLDVPDDIKPHILTSMIKRTDVIAYDVIASQVDGTFTGGEEVWGLSRNGVDYATSGGFVDAHVPTLEPLRQDIIAGTIVVPTVP